MASKGYLVPLGDDVKATVEEINAAGSSFVSPRHLQGQGRQRSSSTAFPTRPTSSRWSGTRPTTSPMPATTVPETYGRPARRSPTRSSPTATRRGASVSVRAAPPAGRRPTGSKTSCCARSCREDYDEWVKQRAQVQRPQAVVGAHRRASADSPRTTRRSPAARRQSAPPTSARAR